MTTLEKVAWTKDGPEATQAHTGSFDALGHRFGVAAGDPRTAALVEQAFGALAVCTSPDGWYRVQRHEDCLELRWEGVLVGTVPGLADLLTLLRTHVQQRAIAAAEGDLVLRAGSVEHEGRVLVLSGARCGVSTLLAALVAAGCSYLNDDVIPVELQTGRVRAFPQPVLLDDRSLDLLPEVSPLRSGADSSSGRRLVAMRCARAQVEQAPRDVAAVLFPEQDDSGLTMLRTVEHDRAVMRLAEQSYNFPGHEQEAIEGMHWLVRDANCYAVVGNDPRCSARAILDAISLAG
jgi:hypothetical protein